MSSYCPYCGSPPGVHTKRCARPQIDHAELIEKWGGQRVEEAMIFIEHAKDHKGLLVSIPCTQERVEAVLKAVYGEYE